MNKKNISPYLRRAWAEIDLDAAKYNFEELRRIVGDKLICAVIKANAYGHGAVRLAELYCELGADCLAVSNLGEALELRRAGIELPILILGYIAPEAAPLASDTDTTLTVYSLPFAEALSKVLSHVGKTVKVHLKFDTGMGRIGFIPEISGENALPDAVTAAGLPRLSVDGAFTHLAVADGGSDLTMAEYTREQAKRFFFAMSYLKERGIAPCVKHISNSAAVLDYPELSVDMVRLGVSLYGLSPSPLIRNPFRPHPMMTLKSVISHIKTVSAGTSVSYGRTFIADHDMRVATVPIGYADGLARSSSHLGVRLTVRGRAVPIIGRVCMDQLMLDVTGTGAELFDEVLIFGAGAYESADTFAEKNGTIGYESVCAVGHRVPRIYKKNGAVEATVDYIG